MGLGSLSTSSSTAEFLALCLRRTEDDIENALSELQRRGLADRVARAGNDTISYQLHDLVFSFAKANKILRETTVMRAGQGFLEKHAPHFQVLEVEITNILGTVEIARQEQPALFVAMMRRLVVGDAYYTARGHSPRSFALHKEAVQVAKDLNDLEAAHYLLSKLGNSYREAYGDLDKALEAFREALEISQVLNNREREAVLLATIGITLFDQTPSDTDSYLSQAYKIAESEQLHIVISQILLHQGFVAGHRQNWEETKRLSEESIRIVHVLKTNPSVSIDEINTNFFFSLLNLGEAERMLGNFDVALSARQEAIQLAKEQDKKLWMAYALQEIGEMYHAVNNRPSAQENYYKALELYEQNNAQADFDKLLSFMKEADYAVPTISFHQNEGVQ
jgi:tetratricopeptide (TPR) repeat protein